MALTRAKKTQKVEVLAQELAGSTSAIVGTFAKLTVSQDFALRQKVREAGGRYRVLKNKLAALASQGTGIEGALQGLKGVSSVAYTSGDPVALAKALSAWVKENSEFTFKLGIVDGKVITVEQVQSLATMPGKDEIFAKLLFLISAPAQRLVTVVNATSRDLAVVIGQGVEKGKFEAGPAEAAPAVASAQPAAAGHEPVQESVQESVHETAHETAHVAEPVAEHAAQSPSVDAAPVAAPVAEAAPAAEEAESAAAPAPAEGPAATGAEAEAVSTQAEQAAGEAPAEG